MMNQLRRERDRFVAFSFAAADLLVEVGPDDTIVYVSGAARAISGKTADALVGQPYDAIFSERDRPLIRRLLGRLEKGGRLDPIAIAMPVHGEAREMMEMILGGCRLPTTASRYYLTLSSPHAAKPEEAAAAGADPATGLLDDLAFEQRAVDVLRQSAVTGKDLSLTLLRMPGMEEFSGQAGAGGTSRFLTEVGALLRGLSLDGTAGRIGDEQYGLVHAGDVDPGVLDERLASIARLAAPAAKPPALQHSEVDLSAGALSEDEAVKALVFTIASFRKSAGNFTITSLADAFDELLKATVTKVKAYKDVVSQNLFELAFQPIVDLDSGAVRHFEVLSRLEGGRSPYQLVTFAEELGIIEQFDLVVCRRALEFLEKERGPLVKLAVNLSAQSLGHGLFVNALIELLKGTRSEDRLLFEITESSQIGDLNSSNAAIQRLRERGYRVGLDDFGAGSASFPYLQALTIDFVKIDGAYVRRVESDERSAFILKAMCNLCRDLGVYTVAEMVETREQLDKLRDLGVDCGQGYLFGKPAPTIVPPDMSFANGAHGTKVQSQRNVYRVWS
jgi:EAL domain-containing protein (putative c-di-GMP-specific phosphodiesterase class I)/GGDEF domain-containing protein